MRTASWFACVLWIAACTTSPSALERERTLELLTAYGREIRSSTLPRESVLPELAQHPEALRSLYRERDPAVQALGGTFFAVVSKTADLSIEAELVRGLGDEDPRWRAFACEALEQSGSRAAVPALRSRLSDAAVVPGFYADPTVAGFAACALAALGSDAGLEVLLEHARRNDSWQLSYLEPLRQATGQDFGTDLGAWEAWAATPR